MSRSESDRPSANAYRLDEPITVYRSSNLCWKCTGVLVRLEPAYNGWEHYCQNCEHLTVTLREFGESRRPSENGHVIGHVLAIPVKFHIEPLEDDS